MSHEQFIAYCRSSTARQTLGLEIQRRAIEDAIRRRQGEVVAWYQEVAHTSPTRARLAKAQPELHQAIEHAARTGATLIVARLDRLTRSTAVIAVLLESGPSLVVADIPNAGPFLLHLYAAVAEEWRRQVSRRCKTAIAVARAKGVRVGPDRHVHGRRMWKRAKAHADRVCPIIEEIRQGRSMSTDDVAAELNARGVRTMRGKSWRGFNVPTAWRWRHRKWSTCRFPGRNSRGPADEVMAAKQRVQQMHPLIEAYNASGATTARAIMARLNASGVRTHTGLVWTLGSTRSLLRRLREWRSRC